MPTTSLAQLHHRVEHVQATPVMPDKIDVFIDVLQLIDEPITVGDIGCRKSERQRGAKPRR